MERKRLIVCCDGTWNKPDNEHVTNIEKIARTVQSDPSATGGVYQLVYYSSGVGGSGYEADRLLGGAFGFGLFHNVIACYRFLAQNYEPGDELFIFGFSRGAYTARSLAGMLQTVGLLTKVALVEERLPWAVHLYQGKRLSAGAFGESIEEFKRDHCHSATVTFLGVFDTVGALGVPGFERETPRFHNVALGPIVQRARHAMAIDETRMKFAPTFWEIPPPRAALPTLDSPDEKTLQKAEADVAPVENEETEDRRVKQVWFEGAHSDIGGGYGETGLSDTTLLWMAREAWAAGLVFDPALLHKYVNSGSDPICHNPLSQLYKLDNSMLAGLENLPWNHEQSEFSHGLRNLFHDRALTLRIASSAQQHFYETGYAPDNVTQLARRTNGFAGIIEKVDRLPEAGIDLVPLGSPAPAPEKRTVV